jgi:hypothetical protein
LPTPTLSFDEVELEEECFWIENAAYFLKEHQVVVTHIEDSKKFFIRLIGQNFSVSIFIS